MDWVNHEEIFSAERMSRFLFACNQRADVAIKLYKYNIQASQALYPLLSIFEISLRNALDRAIADFYNDKNWLLTKRQQFANHPQMVIRDPGGFIFPELYFADKIEKAESYLHSRKKLVTHGRVLTKLMFGFWLKFFDANALRVFKGAPLNALINKPAKSASAIQQHFRSIHLLRNKIAHNEPICFNKGGKICLQTLSDHESKIVEALDWLKADLKPYSDKLNFYKLIYNRISDLVHSLTPLPPHNY
jgi:hypothetical protein